MAVLSGSHPRPALLVSALLLLAPALVVAQAPAPAQPAPAQPSSAAPAPATPPVAAPPVAAPPAAPAPAAPSAAAPAEPAKAAPAGAPESELPDPFAAQPQVPPEEQESLGWTLVRTLLLLAAVLAMIYLTLNVGLRRLMGLQSVGVGRQPVVTVVERVPLDQRRTLFVLKAADEYLLVGGGEGGLQLLSKLDTQAVERIRAESPRPTTLPISPFLQKLLSRRSGSSTPPSQP